MKVNKNKGQSLFEVIFALAVVAIFVVAVLSLSITSISNSIFSKNSVNASRLNQEAIEWLRGQRDQGWNSFLALATQGNVNGTTWCFPILSWGAPSKNGQCSFDIASDYVTDTIFVRSVKFTYNPLNKDSIQIEITTNWVDSGKTHSNVSTTIFTTWNK